MKEKVAPGGAVVPPPPTSHLLEWSLIPTQTASCRAKPSAVRRVQWCHQNQCFVPVCFSPVGMKTTQDWEVVQGPKTLLLALNSDHLYVLTEYVNKRVSKRWDVVHRLFFIWGSEVQTTTPSRGVAVKAAILLEIDQNLISSAFSPDRIQPSPYQHKLQ